MPGETDALEALKAKINDPACPTLDLSWAFDTCLKTLRLTMSELADKLEMSKKRSDFNQIYRLRKLPTEIRKTLEGKVLRPREIRRLQVQVVDDISDDSTDFSSEKTNISDITGDISSDISVTKVTSPVIKGDISPQKTNISDITGDIRDVNTPSQGYPLIRDTIDELVKLLTFWRQQLNLGQIAERWLIKLGQIGWLKTVLSVLVIGFSGYGVWEFGHNIRPVLAHDWRLLTHPSEMSSGGSGQGLFSTVPVPNVSAGWNSGHRLKLTWTMTEPNDTYQVYWRSSKLKLEHAVGEAVKTPGAIVSVDNSWGKGVVFVKAIRPTGEESQPSALEEFDPELINAADSVEPLPLEGAAAPLASNSKIPSNPPLQKGGVRGDLSSAGSSRAVLAVPTDLHYELKTPDLIILSWRAVGPHINYNVYSSGSQDLTNLRKENDRPMTYNSVHWTPETGLDRYWVVVTALDAQGHESNYSQAIEVIRHPEKSNAAMDAATGAAAGTLRKILPW